MLLSWIKLSCSSVTDYWQSSTPSFIDFKRIFTIQWNLNKEERSRKSFALSCRVMLQKQSRKLTDPVFPNFNFLKTALWYQQVQPDSCNELLDRAAYSTLHNRESYCSLTSCVQVTDNFSVRYLKVITRVSSWCFKRHICWYATLLK